jgi:hypothetical protein
MYLPYFYYISRMTETLECSLEVDYLLGFKPGDKIFIEPSQGHPNGNYTIANNWTLRNDKTGMQASTEIPHSNKEYATWDEMNQTHGIMGFVWRPV